MGNNDLIFTVQDNAANVSMKRKEFSLREELKTKKRFKKNKKKTCKTSSNNILKIYNLFQYLPSTRVPD